MKKVITYGTFDLLHSGHINILKRAKALGDYLIVGVTSDDYDLQRGKLNVSQSLVKRIENVRKTGLADEIIVEEYLGQKVSDIKKYQADIFVIGSDWLHQFDYLKEYCEVIYLERTKGVSSTSERNKRNKIVRLGIAGNGRIANRFISESKYVANVDADYVWGRNEAHAKVFAEKHKLKDYFSDYAQFLKSVDAVYIATTHETHYQLAKEAILHKRHVLIEKPMVFSKAQAKELFDLAQKHRVVIFEAIKTVYAPCFLKLINMAQSGIIGKITDITATFTKLITDKTQREYDENYGGAVLELASYPLCVIVKLLGMNYQDIAFTSIYDEESGVDIYTKINLIYKDAMATAKVGIGVKSEGDLVIAGTQGYIYVPAPWWKTEYFEIRFEDLSNTQKVFAKFSGDGLRYELAEFAKAIHKKNAYTLFSHEESICLAEIIEKFLLQKKPSH